ncbi:unnamed protein product [Durusdinium trenchii]|uniref:Uncharacterized protein n=2 Tax=Durusdinium trenchii TaxID=1381693 RepID=A0ABP0SDB8_9DINO
MTFLADGHSANERLFSNVGKLTPPNSLLVRQGCLLHECNHVPEVAFKTLGDLAYMFCTSSLITNGSIYYDLLLHARRVLETKLKIVYSPSETELIEYQGQGISDVYTKPVQDNTNKDYVGGV